MFGEQSLSCTDMLLQRLDGKRTAYLNIFDIMKNLREAFHINRAYQLNFRATYSEIYFKCSWKGYGWPAELIKFQISL